MIRISGVILPAKKHLDVALTLVYGIGRKTAIKICEKVGLKPVTKVSSLTDDLVSAIQKVINEDYKVEGDLRRDIAMCIKRLRDIKCYRGMRHRRGLPVRGQRTKTNARTRKGRAGKRSVGGKKKEG